MPKPYNVIMNEIKDRLKGKVGEDRAKEIRQLTSLEELDLSFNKLRTVPNTLEELPSLKTLNLIHNEIIIIPESLKELELKGLKILL